MNVFDRTRIDYFFRNMVRLSRSKLMNGCVHVVAKCIPDDKHNDAHAQFMMKLIDLHSIDYMSAGRTGDISGDTRATMRLNEMEKGSLIKKRISGLYHFKDGLRPRNSVFSRIDAAKIEDRNYRGIEGHMTADQKVLKTALEVSGAASLRDFIDLIKNRDAYHDIYNKIVAELERKHLTNNNYTYGEMGWRKNSYRWYLSPTAIKLLSDFLNV